MAIELKSESNKRSLHSHGKAFRFLDYVRQPTGRMILLSFRDLEGLKSVMLLAFIMFVSSLIERVPMDMSAIEGLNKISVTRR
jgi:hypothetical protein